MVAKTENIGGIILTFVIGLAIAIAFVGIFLSGINEFSEGDACSDAGCAFDNPAGFCAINSSSEGSGITCPSTVRDTIPLNTLFIVVVPLIFAAGLFLGLRKMLKSK